MWTFRHKYFGLRRKELEKFEEDVQTNFLFRFFKRMIWFLNKKIILMVKLLKMFTTKYTVNLS